MKVDGTESKKIKMTQHVFGFIILSGLISSFTTAKDQTFKSLLLVMIVVIITIYNINHSIKKCDYPNLYKLNLYIRTIIVIILDIIVLISCDDSLN